MKQRLVSHEDVSSGFEAALRTAAWEAKQSPKVKLITGKWLDERLAHQQLQIKFNDTEHESRLKQLLSNC